MKEDRLMVPVGYEERDLSDSKAIEVFGIAFLFVCQCAIWLGKKGVELAWAITLYVLCQIFPYSSGKNEDVEDEGESGI